VARSLESRGKSEAAVFIIRSKDSDPDRNNSEKNCSNASLLRAGVAASGR
jgi:hypothetical protein